LRFSDLGQRGDSFGPDGNGRRVKQQHLLRGLLPTEKPQPICQGDPDPHRRLLASGPSWGPSTIRLPMTAAAADRPFLPETVVSSTVPENGDVNPYGVAIVPAGFPSGGPIAPGDVLVSNFNNSDNLQGTGTTIIKYKYTPNSLVTSSDQASKFFKGSVPGLTTALGVLKRGFVLVGSVSTADGKFATIKAGRCCFWIGMAMSYHPPLLQENSTGHGI
jgi:hypothetical protein